MTRRARSRLGLAVAAAVALLSLLVASSARAQSYSLPDASVRVVVQPDGRLVVDEAITVAFSGRFTFGFRDIPLRNGESIDQVAVSENGTSYAANGSSDKQPDLTPGTFGVAQASHSVSIVWHFQALDEPRVFRVHYRLSGLAVAYDDVVDVNLQVWGKQWSVGLSRLTATHPVASSEPGATPSTSEGTWSSPDASQRCERSTSRHTSSSSSARLSRGPRSRRSQA